MKHVWIVFALLLTDPSWVLAQSTGSLPALAPSPAAAAQTAGSTDTRSRFDKIWQEFTTIYDNRTNPVVQRVLFSGRFQHEFAAISADEGDHDEWNTRRFRMGPRITLFRTITLHGEVELNPQESDPLYVRLTDMYVQWTKSPRLSVTVGKHSMPFTMDGATSSKELLAIDRGSLSNNMWFPYEYIPGVSVSGKASPWTYRFGIYSGGAATREFGKFDGGVATLAVVGYDFADALGVKEALLAANYVHQTADRDNTFTRQLEDVVSVNLKVEADRWGWRSDLSTAKGYLGQQNVWGLMTMPYYNVTDKLQAIGRYTFLDSAGPNGVRLATYENTVVGGRGDRYQELYLGGNYFIYGHKLKLQTGLQFADMNDRANDGGAYSGVAWTSGLRVSW